MAMGGVFPVGDDEVDFVLLPMAGKIFLDGLPSQGTDHIPEEEDADTITWQLGWPSFRG